MVWRWHMWLIVAVLGTGCKTSGSVTKGLESTAKQGGDGENAEAQCQVDSQQLAKELSSRQGYLNTGTAKRFMDLSAEDVASVCPQSAAHEPGANDPLCRAYCDTCTPTLPDDAVGMFKKLAQPISVAKTFASYGNFVGAEALAMKVAVIYDVLDKHYKIDGMMNGTFCFAALYDMGKILYTPDKAGSTRQEQVTRLICHATTALNTCDAIPAIGQAVGAFRSALMSSPVLQAVNVGTSIGCAVGTLVADKVLKCPAYKSACQAVRQNAQPIDNTACCACGLQHEGTGRLAQYWGGSAYAGPESCENRSEAQVRSAFPTMPSQGKAACERVEVDRQRTAGCTFQRVVYGSNISCNQDRNVYCVDQPIYAQDGRELKAVSRPLQRECTQFVTSAQLLEKAASYQRQTLQPVSVDLSAEKAAN